jgi:hypothetical protein
VSKHSLTVPVGLLADQPRGQSVMQWVIRPDTEVIIGPITAAAMPSLSTPHALG